MSGFLRIEKPEPKPEPKLKPSPREPDPIGSGDPANDWTPKLVILGDVEPVPVSWLWKDRIPFGRLTVLAGRPGCGKSFLTLDAAARVTTGRDWPDGTSCPQGSVLILAAEDNLADTVRPRLDAARADPAKVVALQGVSTIAKDGSAKVQGVSLADLDVIEAALDTMPDCKLVIVDPVGSYLGCRTDSHRDNEVRAVLAPLAELAERRGIAVLVVCHTRKGGNNGRADDTVLGSVGFIGIARSVLHTLYDPDDKLRHRKFLLPGKNNLAPPSCGWSFTIEGHPDLQGNPGRVVWGDRIEQHVDDVIEAMCKPGPEADVLLKAVDWLERTLADGPRLGSEIQDEAVKGEGISQATLRRARSMVGVEAYRPEIPGQWWWKLQGAQGPANAA